MIQKPFNNENIELKNYGVIYKESDNYSISNEKPKDKIIIAEVFFQKTLFEKGYNDIIQMG